MRIVATSDTHVLQDVSKIPDGDVFIHAGDLMTTGYLDDWREQLSWLSKLPHKEKFYVPGNHDFHMEVYTGPAMQELRNIGFTVLGYPGNTKYLTAKLSNGMVIGGCPYVPNLDNRWAFGDFLYKKFDASPFEDARKIITESDIVVTHSPMYGVLDYSLRNGKNVGCNEFRLALDSVLPQHRKVKFWLHGHIHEAYGIDFYDAISFYNIARAGRLNYNVNPYEVIDV